MTHDIRVTALKAFSGDGRAATPTGLSRFASSCQHGIAIAARCALVGISFVAVACGFLALPEIVKLIALNVFAVTAFGALIIAGWRLGNGR